MWKEHVKRHRKNIICSETRIYWTFNLNGREWNTIGKRDRKVSAAVVV